MIDFIVGRVAERGPSHCVLEVGGVGLRLAMSTSSLAALPHEGDGVRVHTYLHVREDELSLFGFLSAEEKRLFEQLITVSGVGPKVALAALSSYAPAVLAGGISAGDVPLVSSIPGIGAKTAQRIILELKDKVGQGSGAGVDPRGAGAGALGEARQALASMGFSPAEVAAALAEAPSSPTRPDELVKYALRRLGGGS